MIFCCKNKYLTFGEGVGGGEYMSVRYVCNSSGNLADKDPGSVGPCF